MEATNTKFPGWELTWSLPGADFFLKKKPSGAWVYGVGGQTQMRLARQAGEQACGPSRTP